MIGFMMQGVELVEDKLYGGGSQAQSLALILLATFAERVLKSREFPNL